MTELHLILIQLYRWLRLRDAILTAQRSLWGFCLAALIIQVLGWLIPMANLAILTSVPIAAWLVLVISSMLFQPSTPLKVARRVDLELSLKQRLSTSISFLEFDPAQHNSTSKEMVTSQREDALIHAQQINPQRDLPIIWMKKPLAIAAGMLIVIVILIVLPNPMDIILTQRRAVAQTAENQSAKLDDLAKQLKKNEDISPELQEELAQQLQELSKALKLNSGDLEQALADISNVDNSLKERLLPENQTKAMNLINLASQLTKLSENPINDAEPDIQQAIQALQEISEKAAQLSQAERDQLSMNIAQFAAQTSQTGDLELAQSLSSLSQSLSTGDPTSISRAIDQVESGLLQAEQSRIDQQALSLAIDQLNSSSQQLAQSGVMSSGQPLASSSNTNSSSASNNNSSSSSNPISGGGSRANTLPPAQGVGQTGAPQGPAQNNAQNNSSEPVYAPRQAGAEIGESLFIPGVNLNEGNTDVIEGDSSSFGLDKPALIPYSQVYYQYLQTANQAMDQIPIPASLENFVRDYFTQLEP